MGSVYKYEFSIEDEEEDEKPTLVSHKLRFKLRTNPQTGVKIKEDDQRARRSDGGDESHVCKVCNRVFSSKKAVGGHTRVHKETQHSGNGNGGVSDKSPCQICGRVFETQKALFGHMRCHPERPWRGMEPPNTTSTKPSVRTTINYVHDPHEGCSNWGSSEGARLGLAKCLPTGWPAESRRGRFSSSGGSFAENDDCYDYDVTDEELFMDAVFGLMLFATGDDMYRVSSNDQVEIREDSNDDHDKGKRKLEMDMEVDSGKKRNKKSVSKSSKETELNQTIKIAKTYTCSVCNKSFGTPQALGGHTSSAHNKILIKNMVAAEIVGEGGLDANGECVSVPVVVSPSGGSHVCKICDRAFPSGQALGGHKRLHWQGRVVIGGGVVGMEVEGEVVTPVASTSSPPVARKQIVFSLDLNEVPEDDFEGRFGDGDADQLM